MEKLNNQTSVSSNSSLAAALGAQSGSPAPKRPGKNDADEKKAAEFQGALAVASMTGGVPQQQQPLQGGASQQQKMLQLQEQQQQVLKQQTVPSMTGAIEDKAQTGAKSAARAGLGGSVQTSALDKAAADAGMNTRSALAGLKPWSSEWVFQGERGNPELRTLFGEQGVQAELPGLDEKTNPLQAMGAQDLQDPRESARGGAPAEAMSVGTQEPHAARALKSGMAHAANSAAGGGGLSHESLLAELDGEVLEQAGSAGKAGQPAYSGLSGGEFLAALKQGRGAQAGSQHSGGQGGGSGRDHSDMLKDLRTIQGNRRSGSTRTEEALLDQMRGTSGTGALAGQFTLAQAGMGAPAEVTGHVVQGAMAKERLSSESLQGIGSQIQSLKNGGGEIRVRLNPGNLGELHLRVSTQGNQVGIQIQASDERAKSILEESVSHLKESLAAQSLTLGKIDFTVAQSFGANLGGDSSQQQQAGQQHHQQQQQFGGLMNHQDGGQRNGSNWNDGGSRDSRELPKVSAMPVRPRGMAPGLGSSSRLDVMA